MKKIINKIKFWKRNRKKEAVLKSLPPPLSETVPEDELPFHEGHPI